VILLEILKLSRLRSWVGHRRAIEDEDERRLKSA